MPDPDAPDDALEAWLLSQGHVARPQREVVVQTARSLLPTAPPDSAAWARNIRHSLDCSGFVRAVFAQAAGLSLPRRAIDQSNRLPSVSHASAWPADLVFFNTLGAPASHVGIHLGGRRFIHSPRAGAAVRIESLDLPYWAQRFEGVKRVPGLG